MAARIQFPLEALTSRFNLSRFEGLRNQSLSGRFSNLKPISEFFDFKRISKPANFSEAQARVNYNLSYFSSNYMVVFAMLTMYTLFTNWLLFFVILLVIGGMWGIGKLEGRDLDLGFFRASVSQLYTALICVAVPLGFIANPIGAALWLIGASGVSILGHAAFMDKPIESAFSEEARRKFWESGKGRLHLLGHEDDAVRLDPGYLLQAADDYVNYVGDQLQFTGYDLGAARGSEPEESVADDVSAADYSDQWEVERQRYASQLRAMKERDKALVRSANDKMRRAKEKGRSRATLTPDEIDALERRRLQESSPRHSSSSSKDQRRSSSSGKTSRPTSAANLNVEKTRNKSGSRYFSSPAANSSRTRIPKTSPKPSRHSSLDGSSASNAPGFLVAGPDGHPVYVPTAFSYPLARSDVRSALSGHQPSQPYQGEYIPYSPRYFTPQEHRPNSSATSARRSPIDELHMPRTRERAVSSIPYPNGSHRVSPSSRRNASGPADVDYSRRRRSKAEIPPSPLQQYPLDSNASGGRATARHVDNFEFRDQGTDDVVVVEAESSSSDDGSMDAVRVEREERRTDRVPVSSGRGKEREKKDRRKRR